MRMVDLAAHWDFWPDRVIRGGGCNFYGTRYGSVDFGADGQEKFVVYSTGGNSHELELVPVYGVLEDAGDAATAAVGERLGLEGLNEHRIDLVAGGSDQVWLRSEMADDDGNVWLFVYRCDGSLGDAGCPLRWSATRCDRPTTSTCVLPLWSASASWRVLFPARWMRTAPL